LPLPDDVDVPQQYAGIMAGVASEVCYALSARQFTGACGPVTVRPVSRPIDVDTRFGSRSQPNGYLSSGQFGGTWGGPFTAAVNNYGSSRPPEVDLGAFPVIEIDAVKIDGVLIPPNEYQLGPGRRTLVRLRTSAGATPTERYGWPVNQLLDLPDTEQGTFSITYTYGTPPPQTGWLAAVTLARQLLLNALDLENSLPSRVTAMTRQGVTVQIADIEDFLKNGDSGIYEVDLFVLTFNPSKQRLPSLVWSPDTGRARRMPQS
jgi:hypothetical protein